MRRSTGTTSVMALVSVVALLAGGTALADTAVADGDAATAGGQNVDTNIGDVCVGGTKDVTTPVYVSRLREGTGNNDDKQNRYANGSTVTVTRSAASGVLDVTSGTAISISSTWADASNGTLAGPSSWSIRITAPTSAGAFHKDVTYTTTGVNAQNAESALVRGDQIRYSGNAVNCAAAKQNQTITFTQPATPATYGDSFSVAPTASSNLPVTVTAADGCAVTAGSPGLTYTIAMRSGTTKCTLTASQAGNDQYNAATSVVREVQAQKRSITVTADGKAKSYGEADPELTASVTSGNLVNGDVLSGSLTRATGEVVGEYAISQGTLAASTNYVVSFVGNKLTVTQRAVTVSAAAKSKTYGEVDPALTYTVTSGSLASGDSFAGALSRTAGEGVGPWAITQGTLALSSNYALSYNGANLTIGKRPVTVTAEDKSKVYGDNDPALTYRLTSGSLVQGDGFTGSLARAEGANVGEYAITDGSLTAGGNYDLTVVPAKLTVTARPITVTANDAGKTYGGIEPELGVTVTSGNLVGTDALSGSVTRVVGESGGTYAINQGTLSSSNNYTMTFRAGTFTIAARAITVTADAKSKTYGESDPDLTYRVTSGALVGDDSFTGALSRTSGGNAGKYSIGQGDLSINGSNYAVTFVGADLTINPRPLTVTVADKTKTYGADDPTLTYAITSGDLVGADTFSGSLTRAEGSNVDKYAITQGGLTAGSNYTLTVVPGELVINRRAITVKADDKTKAYGDADPPLTTTVTNGSLVPGDSLTGALTRDAGQTVGDYAITQSTLTAGNNYTLTYQPGTLTITGWNYGVGFKSPISTGTKVNQAKAGSAVPLKFNVHTATAEKTDDATVTGTVTVTSVCHPGTSKPAASTSKAGLRYDTTGGQWVFNWKVPTAAGCYQVGVALADGQTITAVMQVK